MSTEQWFWMVLSILNAYTLGMRTALMARDGADKIDYAFIIVGVTLITYGVQVLAS